ncbi:hypothetical protein AMS68_000624 [Peltaster fructicola]|uniref:NYN domain-containing protein n=1 Tax=Peltaster fructicola TaxID=286661 RepID=A0A6H0XK44_9PEZI|nr:hypothetical protein AMS68_000624 [Peltaster fructicola]
MRTNNAGEHLAVLIDGDNVSSKVIAGLLAEVAKYGTVSVKRICGDWTSPQMNSWRNCLLEHSIVPIQQFAYTTGKNATDGAMIIDAMDLLYTGRFSSFCLVSSDSDFTRLAARLREQGISVYGFGDRNNTSRALVAAFDEFVYFDALPVQKDEPEEPPALMPQSASELPDDVSPQSHGTSDIRQVTPTGPRALMPHQHLPLRAANQAVGPEPASRPLDQVAVDGLRKAISSCNIYEEDYVNLADVGAILVRMSPDLNARN